MLLTLSAYSGKRNFHLTYPLNLIPKMLSKMYGKISLNYFTAKVVKSTVALKQLGIFRRYLVRY